MRMAPAARGVVAAQAPCRCASCFDSRTVIVASRGGSVSVPDRRPTAVRRQGRGQSHRTRLQDAFPHGPHGVINSFAALLSGTYDLHVQPRNPANPERFANYGLAPHDDQRLSTWMRDRLSLAVWAKPSGVALLDVERALLATWQPPLRPEGRHDPLERTAVGRGQGDGGRRSRVGARARVPRLKPRRMRLSMHLIRRVQPRGFNLGLAPASPER